MTQETTAIRSTSDASEQVVPRSVGRPKSQSYSGSSDPVVPMHKPLDKNSIAYRQERNKQLVRGIFRDYEVPGGRLEFSFGPEFKGDKTNNYSMIDGQTYEIPYGVAWHLNNRCFYPEFEHRANEPFINGQEVASHLSGINNNVRIAKKVHRFGFQSLDFFEPDISPAVDLYTVEKSL